ncbi:MAG: hypothetical protein ACTHW1_11650, partial [Ancrocorticia sp.]|uniref:hypothetical protein n=1 Tax=Ancrocorticia sp. TaxID=2593684 RepID=UPI003F930DF0
MFSLIHGFPPSTISIGSLAGLVRTSIPCFEGCRYSDGYCVEAPRSKMVAARGTAFVVVEKTIVLALG